LFVGGSCFGYKLLALLVWTKSVPRDKRCLTLHKLEKKVMMAPERRLASRLRGSLCAFQPKQTPPEWHAMRTKADAKASLLTQVPECGVGLKALRKFLFIGRQAGANQTKIFLPGFFRSSVRNSANTLSFGNEQRHVLHTRCVTVVRSLSRDPRRSTTILIPIFARMRNRS
jgi:hypothetical protein